MEKAEEIQIKAEELKTIYAKRNRLFTERHNWKTRNIVVHIPPNFQRAEGYKAVQQIPGYVKEMADRISAILSATPPVARVIPLRETSEKQKQATKIERWCNHTWAKIINYPVLVDCLVEYGMVVVKALEDRHDWGGIRQAEDEEASVFNERRREHKRKHYPFKSEIIPPFMYYPIDDGKDEVLIITKRRARLVALRYGMDVQGGKLVKSENLGPKGPDSDWPQTVDFIEFWDKEKVYYVVDDEIVEEVEHNYGRPPFFVALARPSSAIDLAEKTSSYLDNLIPIAESMALLMTTLFNWFQLNGFPTFMLEQIAEFAAAPLESLGGGHTVDLKPGGLTEVPWGYVLKALNVPEVGSSAIAVMSYLERQYQSSALSQVLMGENLGGDQSNAALVTMIAVAKSVFAPGIKELENMFSEIAKYLLQRIELGIKEPVPIRVVNGDKEEWLDLGPKDIDGYWEVEHSIKPVIPAERFQQQVMTHDAYARGTATLREAIESRGSEAPEEVMVELLADKYTDMPQFVNLLMAEVIRRIGGEQPAPVGTPANQPLGASTMGGTVMPGVQQPVQPGMQMPAR